MISSIPIHTEKSIDVKLDQYGQAKDAVDGQDARETECSKVRPLAQSWRDSSLDLHCGHHRGYFFSCTQATLTQATGAPLSSYRREREQQ